MKQISSCVNKAQAKHFMLTLCMVMICLNGCSQNDLHNFHAPGKIPIDAGRWYVLNSPSSGVKQLFDNNQYQRPTAGDGMALQNFDAYYTLLPGEDMTIDSIEMFDWEGTNEEHPMTIYAIRDNGPRLLIAKFTGARYNAWNGPDPKTPDVFAVKIPIGHIRSLVINSWGDFPGEIEFYGKYTPPQKLPQVTDNDCPLKNFFGINAFEWDFLNEANHNELDPVKIAAIGNFTAVRHYMDWEKLEEKEGVYSFAPTTSGGWNYDTVYKWCWDHNITVLACLKTLPTWIVATYPKDEQDNENIPMRAGKDPADPQSYIEQARAGFQYAARYGNNKNIDPKLIKLDPSNQFRLGLGTVGYIECDNERDKWWKGRKAYQTGREYAANLSAFYDGNHNTMGPGVGVKNADPTMKVVMAGTAGITTDFVRGMIDWSREFRGYRDGGVDIPWDITNYHFYSNDADYTPNKKQTTGIAPELSKAAAVAHNFVQMAHTYGIGPVWVTEAGYDVNQQSPQRAIPIKGKTALQTQADWTLRTSLLYARAGLQKVFYYELMDDNPKLGSMFSTAGLVNADRSPRPVADYMRQVNKHFGQYAYKATISNDPIVDKYSRGDTIMYMLVVPDQKGRTATYTLDLGNATTAYIYSPKAGSIDMELTQRNTSNGKVEIMATETPVFVTSSLLK